MSDDSLRVESARALARGDLFTATEAMHKQVLLHARMGLQFVQVEPEATILTMELGEEVQGSAPGTVHGGALATFADVTSAIALTGAFDPSDEIPVTTDLHVRYYRQPTSGPLTAEARIVHRGRRLLSTECTVVDGDQRVLARATATYMIVATTPS